MNFSTADWEFNQTGERNAKELFDANVRKKKFLHLKGQKRNIAKNKVNKKVDCLINPTIENEFRKKPIKETKTNILKKNLISKNNISKQFASQNSHNLNSKSNTNSLSSKNKNLLALENTREKINKERIYRKQKNKIKEKVVTNKLIKFNIKNMVQQEPNELDASSKIRSKTVKLINLLSSVPGAPKKKKKEMSLRDRMMEKLKSSRFRYLNQQIYNSESKETQRYFKQDPMAFHAYHEGYKQQVSKWPLNPLDIIIKSIKKMPPQLVIADFGCGEATLAKSVLQKIHSFDIVAVNQHVTACDMANVPLENDSVDVVVFCLSLMGSNIKEYLFEANRVLKNGGKLKIAEVESRFDTVELFIEGVKRFGFMHVWKDLSHNLFYFLDFKKISKCKSLSKLPTISLHPCLYKKR